MTSEKKSHDPAWLENGLRSIWLPYTQMKGAVTPCPVVGAEGSKIFLADGTTLVDGIASWWSAAHGYRHPMIEAAILRQLKTLPHVMLGGLAHEQAYTLSARLVNLLPQRLSRVFFSESGSVSVEVALKMACQYFLNQGVKRTRFLSFNGGYHGDTFAAMSICDPEEGMHSLFSGVLSKNLISPLPTDEEKTARFMNLIESNSEDIAAVIVEPYVQGAGGMLFHDMVTLKKIRDATKAIGAFLIFDEIFVGFGRLGTSLFACQRDNIIPDILTLSKALTGGSLPLAATIASDEVFDGFLGDSSNKALMHGPTFMGNALACAAANASLDIFEEGSWIDDVNRVERQMQKLLMDLKSLPGVVDVRVFGAIGVVETGNLVDLDWMRRTLLAKNVWVRPIRNIIYLTPPLNISDHDLTYLCHAVRDATHEWSNKFGS